MTKNRQGESMYSTRPALMLWILIIGFVSEYVMRTLSLTSEIGEDNLHVTGVATQNMQMLIIVGWIIIQALLLWFSPKISSLHPLVLMVLQVVFTVTTTYSLQDSMPVLFIGLAPVIMIECINSFERPQPYLYALGLLYGCLVIAYGCVNGLLQGFLAAQALVFTLFAVLFYWRFYTKQLKEKQRIQDLLEEVRIAYSQVEKSTQRAERQRVARELHDTLIQGLAGTVMQLEAAQSFLNRKDSARGTQILEEATSTARQTLREARVTLTLVRGEEEKGLGTRLSMLISTFEEHYGLHLHLTQKNLPILPSSEQTEIVRIVSEALMNIVKHANTKEALVSAEAEKGMLTVIIADKGIGATVKAKKNHYGLDGMKERAQLLGGTLSVSGVKGQGTTVSLKMPLAEGATA